MSHGVTPEPPAGSEQYREGWRTGYEQAMQDVRDRGHVAGALSAVLEGARQHGDTIDRWERDRAELKRLRTMYGRAMDVQDWCQDEASESAIWRAATYIRNGAAPGVDPRSSVLRETS